MTTYLPTPALQEAFGAGLLIGIAAYLLIASLIVLALRRRPRITISINVGRDGLYRLALHGGGMGATVGGSHETLNEARSVARRLSGARLEYTGGMAPPAPPKRN